MELRDFVAETIKYKWLLIVVAGILLLAFFTNPDQAQHLKAIKETRMLRESRDFSVADMLLPQVEHRNYGVFSTTTFGDSNLSYGYFGTVHTTDNVGFLYGSRRLR
jgi:hypothetical protein